MGKDWHWGYRSTKRAGGGGGGEGATGICGGDKDTSATTTTPSGCMSAVLQFFDFHHFQFALHHPKHPLEPHSFIPEEPTLLKGLSLTISFPFSLCFFFRNWCVMFFRQLFSLNHALFFLFLLVFQSWNDGLCVFQAWRHQGIVWNQRSTLRYHQCSRKKKEI